LVHRELDCPIHQQKLLVSFILENHRDYEEVHEGFPNDKTMSGTQEVERMKGSGTRRRMTDPADGNQSEPLF
jgi:hypothetical protein